MSIEYLREDRSVVRRLADQVEPYWERRFAEVFTGHRAVATSFQVKYPDESSGLFLHRDLPAHDERTDRCYTVWVPLVDVEVALDNGVLHVVPGSEHLDGGTAGVTTPVLAEPFFPSLEPLLRPVEVSAGTALVFDARILHASPPNRSGEVRPTVACLLARRSAPLVHVVATGRRHRLLYEVDRDFFIDHHPHDVRDHGMPSRYRVVDEYDEHTSLGVEDLAEALDGDVSAVPVVSLPEDVRGEDRPEDLAPFPALPKRWRPTHRHDLSVRAADLAPSGSPAGTDRLIGRGSWGTVELRRRSASAPGVDGVDLPGLLRTHRSRHALLVVMDPGSRVEIRPTDERSELLVVECPQVRSGIRSATAASNLHLGDRLRLDGASATLWNDGPGSLVAVLLPARKGPLQRLRSG